MLYLNRRTIVRGFLHVPVLHVLGALGLAYCPAGRAAAGEDPCGADKWFRELMGERPTYKDFGSPLDLRRFKDPVYVVLSDLPWKQTRGVSDTAPVTVPRGFVTDLASVPRPFWSIFRPDGDFAYAAILHDYLYWVQDRPRQDADRVFRHAMDDLKIDDFQATTLYTAVKDFGGDAWKKNQQLKAAGERRILARLPDRSDITWAEWKKRNDVY